MVSTKWLGTNTNKQPRRNLKLNRMFQLKSRQPYWLQIKTAVVFDRACSQAMPLRATERIGFKLAKIKARSNRSIYIETNLSEFAEEAFGNRLAQDLGFHGFPCGPTTCSNTKKRESQAKKLSSEKLVV